MDHISKYADFLKKHIDVKRPLKIVCDASNGTTGIILEKLAGVANLELILINTTPDPEFPAHGPNPLLAGATDMLAKKVLEVSADFGVAFDADGDRAFFVDNKGKLLSSFITAAIWFNHSTPPFVTDELVYLSLTTSGICKEQDITPSRVGVIFIKEAMRKNNAILGAEFSGHFYFKEFFGLDSGIFAMIYTANILSGQNKTLAELHTEFSRQELVNINITLKKTTWPKVLEAVKKAAIADGISDKMFEREGLTLITPKGWINVRSSNTEPLVRISVGSATRELAEKDVSVITKIVQETDERDS